jgi:predicted nucleic acid-binding protein
MKVLFDTSVWVDHLRNDTLSPIIPAMRGKFMLCFDTVSAAELRAGCRSKRERQGIARLLSPFEKAGRIAIPEAGDYVRAGEALSRLRERGKTLKRPLIASVGARLGALVVTVNVSDFALLAAEIPVRTESFAAFSGRL